MDEYERLKVIISGMGSVVIAFSGGVDSSLLLKAAVDSGARVVPVTAVSGTYTPEELEDARCIARELGLDLVEIATDEMEDPRFRENPPERCYFCKGELFEKLRGIADSKGIGWIADGENLDDADDHRPGTRAGREAGVRHPLAEAGLGKEAIREISRELGLPTWDRPSAACLASRIPYGSEITPEKLGAIGSAESLLRSLGFREVRVRHHGTIARIEVPLSEMGRILSESAVIVDAFKDLGFTYVTLDMAGFRSGSMNEVLDR